MSDGPANIGTVFRRGGSGERQVTKEITYTNAGGSPLTLDLTVDGDVLRTSGTRITTTHLPVNVGQQGAEIVLDTRQANRSGSPWTSPRVSSADGSRCG